MQVIKHAQLSNQDTGIIPAIARVLAWSQKYMRERKVSNRYIIGTKVWQVCTSCLFHEDAAHVFYMAKQ